jgi:biopolymer transport protein ExbB/TolQ
MMEASLVTMGVKQMLLLNMVTAASILLIWYLTHKAENAKWKQQRKDDMVEREAERLERERQASEHMEKWNSMLNQHQEENERLLKQHAEETERLLKQHGIENDRAYRLLERQTQVNEVHAALLQTISTKLNNYSICPVNSNKG